MPTAACGDRKVRLPGLPGAPLACPAAGQPLAFLPKKAMTGSTTSAQVRTRFRAAAPALLLAALLVPAGCGGASFSGGEYRGHGMAFQVGPVPPAWRRIEVGHALLAFRDDAAEATIALNGRCNKDGDDVPLSALTHHLFLMFTHRNIISQRTLPMDGRAAMRTELVAELDGVPKHFVVYVLKKDNCVYDFIHIAAMHPPQSSMRAFKRFVTGFATTG